MYFCVLMCRIINRISNNIHINSVLYIGCMIEYLHIGRTLSFKYVFMHCYEKLVTVSVFIPDVFLKSFSLLL